MSEQSQWGELLEKFAAAAGGELNDAKAKTRARLLRVATELFATQGYRRTSMEDVARAAQMAKGTVYLYFKNKQDLLFHAITEEKRRYSAAFLPLFKEELKPEARLRRYLELGLTSLRSAPLTRKLMTGDRELVEFLEELGPALKEQIERGQEAGMAMLLKGVGHYDRLDPEERAARAKAMVGMMYAAPVFMEDRFRGDLTPERYAQVIAKLIVEGVGAP